MTQEGETASLHIVAGQQESPDDSQDGQQKCLGDGTPIPKGMTKSAFKKQRRQEAWQAATLERKAIMKEKRKQKDRKKKQQRRELPQEEQAEQRRLRNLHERNKRPFRANVVVDCGFDELMTDKEVSSMGQQLSFLYASNRRSSAPFSRVILAGPSRQPVLSLQDTGFLEPSATNGQRYEPNESAIECGYQEQLQKCLDRGQCLSFDDSRLGKRMNSIGDEQWKRWNKVNVVPHGGLEALWNEVERLPVVAEGQDLSKAQTASADLNLPSNESISAADDGANEASAAQEPSLLPDSSSKKRKRKGGPRPQAAPDGEETPLLNKEDIIYLTADTDDAIATLEEGKTYIIGGVVDRNRYKNICLAKARSLGLRVARLPIDPDHLGGKTMSSRKVLTVNQVFDILLGWTEQFVEIQRKQQKQNGKPVGKGQKEQTSSLPTEDQTSPEAIKDASEHKPELPDWAEALARGLPERKFVTESKKARQQKQRTSREAGEEDGSAAEESHDDGARNGDIDQDEDDAALNEQESEEATA